MLGCNNLIFKGSIGSFSSTRSYRFYKKELTLQCSGSDPVRARSCQPGYADPDDNWNRTSCVVLMAKIKNDCVAIMAMPDNQHIECCISDNNTLNVIKFRKKTEKTPGNPIKGRRTSTI
jgi:hypothetical protein